MAAKKPAAKKARPAEEPEVEPDLDGEVPAPVEYHDQESEWDDARFLKEESEATQFVETFTGGKEVGLAGKTEVSRAQATVLTHFRVTAAQLRARGFKWIADEMDSLPKWLETYNLSLGRKSRVETVDVTRGRVEIGRKEEVVGSNPTRFN